MENYSEFGRVDEEMELPPGFRFHPTDEELITHYLCHKVLNAAFEAVAIGEVDLNKVEPWDLPRNAKMGEKEWYFFCVRDRKYPTGMRTNRATEAGYWKATGKDKEIYESKTLVGMKKTLVFYTGRAPKGEKTNWIIHEYRLEGKYSKSNLPQTAQNEWVISRVFEKSSGPKNPNYHPSFGSIDEVQPRVLPPLMDSSSPCNNIEAKAVAVNPTHVTCFSGLIGNENQKTTMTTTTTTNIPTTGLIGIPTLEDRASNLILDENTGDFDFMDSVFVEDDSLLKLILEGTDEPCSKAAVQQETTCIAGAGTGTDTGSGEAKNEMLNYGMYQNCDAPIDLEGLWGY